MLPLAKWSALNLAAFSWLASVTSDAQALDIQHQGLRFSDELGGFHLLAVSGAGTLSDPIVVLEDVTGPKPPVLIIRGLSPAFGNRTSTLQTTSFAMEKIVINHTGHDWRNYRLELREILDIPSNYDDGLSFGQYSAAAQYFTGSPNFARNHRVNEPEDSITYMDGDILPNGIAVMHFIVADNSPTALIYLLQSTDAPVAERVPSKPRVQLAMRRDMDR